MLIIVTTKLDVAAADGRSSHRLAEPAKAIEVVREFLDEWRLREQQ
jgi:hypothetical protein